MSAGAQRQQSERVMTCPACKTEVMGMLTLDVKLKAVIVGVERIGNAVPADVTLTGVRVQHDCTPKATR